MRKMSCICLGPKNAGKTHLLTSLQTPGSVNTTSHSVATVGTNLYSIRLPDKTVNNKKSKNYVQIREVGGTMAPMWKNYLNDINKIIYVVDTSNLCQISAAGVLFYSLLAEPRLQHTKILIALTKMDLAYRQMRNEALLMLQLEKLKKQIRQNVVVIETSAITEIGNDKILEWLNKP